MRQLQLHVREGSKLGCPICASVTSDFGAHGLKNDWSHTKLPSDSEIRGVGVLRARKPGHVFWQKCSMCMWIMPLVSTWSILPTPRMTASTFSATNLVTHASSPVGAPATRSPFVDTPASIAARSKKDCRFTSADSLMYFEKAFAPDHHRGDCRANNKWT